MRRIRVGRDVQMTGLDDHELELVGRTRLRPGEIVELVDTGVQARARRALVLSWAVASLGTEGASYRGRCRWRE